MCAPYSCRGAHTSDGDSVPGSHAAHPADAPPPSSPAVIPLAVSCASFREFLGSLPSNRFFRHLSIMEALQQETDSLRRMSPEQKLTVMHALIRQAWELKAAAVRARHPELPEPEVRARAWELVGGDRP